jgi:hypothetical protein
MTNESNSTALKPIEKRKAAFIKAFPEKACNISETAAAIGIDRNTYYRWRDEDEEFRSIIENAREATIDFAECQLLKQIKDGNITAIIFFLKTRGRSRGYIERPSFGELNELKPIEGVVIVQ